MKHNKASTATQVVHLLDMPNGGASDLLLKKEVVGVAGALKRMLALRPVTWYWKDDSRDKELQYGFIAQEVERVFPDLVSSKECDDGTSYKYLKTKGLIPYIVKAFEEQQQQIAMLERQLNATKDKQK